MLGRHNAIRPAVGLAGNDGDLGDCGLSKSKQQLGAMADDAAILLLSPGKKTGYVFERNQRNVEGIAETHEASALGGSVDVQHARQKCRLVGHNAHGTPIQPGKAHHDIFCIMFMHLKKIAVIHDASDDVLDVVRLV